MKVQLSHTKILEENKQKYYVVGNQFLEYRINLKLDLVKSFSEFFHVYERYDNFFNLITYNTPYKTELLLISYCLF